MKSFLDRLKSLLSGSKPASGPALNQTGRLKQTGSHRVTNQAIRKPAVPRRQPEFVEPDPTLKRDAAGAGRDQDPQLRSKYIREDTGTHETLTILDDSAIDSEEPGGIDPYNTGQFDRSKNWDKRFRKN